MKPAKLTTEQHISFKYAIV